MWNYILIAMVLPGLAGGISMQCPDAKISCPEGKRCCLIDSQYECCVTPVDMDEVTETPLLASESPEIFMNHSVNAQNLFDMCNWITCSGTCCSSTSCCPKIGFCCPDGDGTCCKNGQTCCVDRGCCRNGHKCCGDGCCPLVSQCCGDYCCPPTHDCCGQRQCCGPSRERCLLGICIGAGVTYKANTIMVLAMLMGCIKIKSYFM